MKIEARLSPTSSIHKHYEDTRFALSGINGKMANLKYLKFGVWSSITVPIKDIKIIGNTDIFD